MIHSYVYTIANIIYANIRYGWYDKTNDHCISGLFSRDKSEANSSSSLVCFWSCLVPPLLAGAVPVHVAVLRTTAPKLGPVLRHWFLRVPATHGLHTCQWLVAKCILIRESHFFFPFFLVPSLFRRWTWPIHVCSSVSGMYHTITFGALFFVGNPISHSYQS